MMFIKKRGYPSNMDKKMKTTHSYEDFFCTFAKRMVIITHDTILLISDSNKSVKKFEWVENCSNKDACGIKDWDDCPHDGLREYWSQEPSDSDGPPQDEY